MDALEGDLCDGSAGSVDRGLVARRVDDDGARARGTASVGRRRTSGSTGTRPRARRGWSSGRARRRIPGRAMAPSGARRRSWRCGARIRTGGRASWRRSCAEREPAAVVAGAEHDGRSVAPRRAEYAAPAAAVHRAADAAAGGGAGRRMMCGRPTSKAGSAPADGTRCDPLTVADACSRFVLCCRIVAPTGVGRAAVVRAHVSDVWVAARVADRQRLAVCVDGAGAAVALGGVVVEARHPARSDRSRAIPSRMAGTSGFI